MSVTMISVAPDALSRLLALRLSEDEALDEVLRRTLTNTTKPSLPPIGTSGSRLTSGGPSCLVYQLLGEADAASDANEAMVKIIAHLAQYDDDFFPKLANKVRGGTRNHVARSRSDVYPRRPDLAGSARQVAPGWFIGCNVANREKVKILRAACDVAGIAFGRDLKIDLAHA